MLIYLDANIVQYCADHEDFILCQADKCPIDEPKLRRELLALRQLVELDQFADWVFAAPRHLIGELHAGERTAQQRETYTLFRQAWEDSESVQEFLPNQDSVDSIEKSLTCLNLKDSADRRHLAEAIALNASWFLTNDREIVRKSGGKVCATRVSLPSQCLEEMSIGLFLR